VSATPTRGFCLREPFGCAIDSLAPGESATVTLLVQPTEAQVGLVRADFVAGSATGDPHLANNFDGVLYTVDPRTADVNVTMRAPAQARVGNSVTHTIIVKNSGRAPAEDVRLTATMVGALVAVESPQGSCTGTALLLTCSLGTLARNQTTTITVVTTLGIINIGPGTDHAAVVSATVDPDVTNNAVQRPLLVRP
jgi:uncharacterized repeat protein (TIGR01451 family)